MRRLLLRIWNLFWRDTPERELARELQSHLLQLEDEYRRRGMNDDEARSAARRSLGGVELAKERHRDARSVVWLEDARRDVIHAMRSLRQRPVVAASAVLSLAIGIGANTAIFTVVNALLFRTPVGVAHPDRLVDIGAARDDGGL